MSVMHGCVGSDGILPKKREGHILIRNVSDESMEYHEVEWYRVRFYVSTEMQNAFCRDFLCH